MKLIVSVGRFQESTAFVNLELNSLAFRFNPRMAKAISRLSAAVLGCMRGWR